jgi:replicative DNA helicase
MSAEAAAISAVVREGAGGLRKVYQHGVSRQDFQTYEEEFAWIEERVSQRAAISQRVFRRRFPDFEWLPTDERLADILIDLKNERAFIEVNSLINTIATELEVENAVEKAEAAREILGDITRLHAPASDHAMISGWRDHYEEQRNIRNLRNAGEPPGIPTGLAHIDHHWDGLVQGRMIIVLGRPGEGKTYLVDKFAAHAIYNKYRVILFSPEMSKREHLNRIHTLLSAYPDIKEACGLEHSFRNRALMRGIGYNMKRYKRFMEYLEGNCGEVLLMTSTHRRVKMSPAFIESRVSDLAPDLILVDPIYKLQGVKSRNSRIEELSDISDALQDISETYNIPVVVTNQAHRQMTGKGDAPHKDSSFNSDVPVQEADHVIGVKNISDERRMIVRCSKSRFGDDFRFELKFHPNTGVMIETTKPTTNYMNGDDEDMVDEELETIVKTAVTGSKRKAAK